jgi:hypothetical protein
MSSGKLIIDSHEYDVIFDPEWGLKTNDDGGTVFDATTIILDSSTKKSRQELTIFHEILEIGNEHNEWKLEHERVQQISNFMYQALKGNKLLVANFLKKVGAPSKVK